MAHVHITNLLSDNPNRRSSKTINALELDFSRAHFESVKQLCRTTKVKQPEMTDEIFLHLEGNVISSYVKR
jgi:hypothetical protein